MITIDPRNRQNEQFERNDRIDDRPGRSGQIIKFFFLQADGHAHDHEINHHKDPSHPSFHLKSFEDNHRNPNH